MKTKEKTKKIDWISIVSIVYRIIGIVVLVATAYILLFHHELLENKHTRYMIVGSFVWSIYSILMGIQNLRQLNNSHKSIEEGLDNIIQKNASLIKSLEERQ